jgi:ASC-1-like (ASCH) protein/ADP-ribose pyrophosphatase YjhB (NUDIX family)
MQHEMRLAPDPFHKIVSGKKTIELRLYDEKRQQIRVGDTIRFTCTEDTAMTATCIVKQLHLFPSFDALYATLPLIACGYDPTACDTASPRDMEVYYSPAEQARYGVVGIELVLLSHQVSTPWLAWATELQSIAQAGLFYGKDPFDLERYARLGQLAVEILSYKTDIPATRLPALFCGEEGYQTPKIDTRCAVIADGKILLVQERNGRWCLPGGWNDVDLSIGENVVKEAWEEAGARVTPIRLVSVHYRDKHPFAPGLHKICKTVTLCRLESIAFQANTETLGCGFFPPDALPPLDTDRTIPLQIELAFAAAEAAHWETVFD